MRLLGYVILVVGIVVLAFGINSTQKVPEQVVENVVGRYTSGTMWYIVGGIAMIVAGAGLARYGKD